MPISPDVVRSLDGIARLDMESCRDFFAICLFWSTFAVVIGCALEVPEVADELWDEFFPKSWEHRIKVTASVGLLLVILGVAGELVFEHWESRYSDLLVTFNNILLTDAQLQSTQAESDAANARKETAQLQKDEQGLKTKAAEADARAETEKLARIELEKQIEPRLLTQADRIAIAEDLRKFAPNFSGRPIKIQSQVGDSEGLLFALAIGNILDRAGIQSDSTGVGRMLSVGGLQFGAVVSGASRDGEFIKMLVGDVQKKSTGGIKGQWKPSFTECTIFVGVKPIKDMQKLLDVELK